MEGAGDLGGISVWVPGLPECVSRGETEAEALANIREAIGEHLSVADRLSLESARGSRS
ncbi:MAG: type II toxin-antitoxin system HicB family antitoxin [Acidobacteria bacterium]|nr:type II toxin-antitoxin system HicB family antitoxin [Acidobacteriota bacterium]